jgi:hypothetical protein
MVLSQRARIQRNEGRQRPCADLESVGSVAVIYIEFYARRRSRSRALTWRWTSTGI